jgi:membrane protein CcdC involved in cytochrome C biogenesis
VKLRSFTAYTKAGVDFGSLLGCWPSYAFPRIVPSRIDMFFLGPSLESS